MQPRASKATPSPITVMVNSLLSIMKGAACGGTISVVAVIVLPLRSTAASETQISGSGYSTTTATSPLRGGVVSVVAIFMPSLIASATQVAPDTGKGRLSSAAWMRRSGAVVSSPRTALKVLCIGMQMSMQTP